MGCGSPTCMLLETALPGRPTTSWWQVVSTGGERLLETHIPFAHPSMAQVATPDSAARLNERCKAIPKSSVPSRVPGRVPIAIAHERCRFVSILLFPEVARWAADSRSLHPGESPT
jgi:hypothetical protein